MKIYPAPQTEANAQPGIRNSIRMIRYGTKMFILNIIIPLALAGIGFIFSFTSNTPLPDVSSLKTVEAEYKEMEVIHMKGSDSYTITSANGMQYSIGHIYSRAFDDQSFERVIRGKRIFVSVDETEMPYSNGIQPIYSVSTDTAVYLSAEDALDAIQNNANLGKAMFPVMLGIATLYLCLFLFAMTNAKKYHKLLRLFIYIKPEEFKTESNTDSF